MKGEEAKVAMEELLSQQKEGGRRGGGDGAAPSDRDLMNRIVELESEIRERDNLIGELHERRESPSLSASNTSRLLRQENEDLKVKEGGREGGREGWREGRRLSDFTFWGSNYNKASVVWFIYVPLVCPSMLGCSLILALYCLDSTQPTELPR